METKETATKKKSVFAVIHEYFTKKGVSLSPKKYFVDAMGTMALGLFATLLMGTILSTVGKYTGFTFLSELSTYANSATGAVLGIAIAYRLEAPPLVLFSAGVAGVIGNGFATVFVLDGVEKAITAGPAGAFICALIATEIGKLVSKTTPIDIIVTPTLTILVGGGIAYLLCPAVSFIMYEIGFFVNTTTEMFPLLMGALVAIVVGVVLTLPISSAALCAMIGISGLAGGAAAAGCCAQMIGFAVISFRENKWGGLVAQGLGTSMLQMGNIVKNPRIWIAPTLASAFTGALSASLFRLTCSGVSAGMGTCGLVGPLGIISEILVSPENPVLQWIGLFLICFILPAILSLLFDLLLRKVNWVKDGDMKLEL